MRRPYLLCEYVATAFDGTGLFRQSIASWTDVVYRSRLPVQLPDDIPWARSESHSDMITTPPRLNVFDDITAAVTVPPTPAPTSPGTPPPSGILVKMLTPNLDFPHWAKIMLEHPPILICFVCVKDKRFLNTGGFDTKQASRFGVNTMIWMRLVL